MNNTNRKRGFTIIASLQTATVNSGFGKADLKRLPAKLRRIQVCEDLSAESFELLAQYLQLNPNTEVRLFSMLAAKSCYDCLWPLAHMHNLRRLAIDLVHLKSVEHLIPLAGSLQSLSVGAARCKGLDFSWLRQAVKLESVGIDGQTEIRSVLHELPRMRVLRLANLNFASDFGVPGKLEQLELTQCQFQNVGWLSGLKKLQYLKLDKVADVQHDFQLSILPRSLKALWLHDMKITDLSDLAGLRSLESIKLSKIPGDLEVAVLSKLTRLAQLVLERVGLRPFKDPPAALIQRLDRLVIDRATLKCAEMKADEFAEYFPQTEVRGHAALTNWP